MEFRLKDARPIWQQLTEQMTERIVTGKYEAGARFPSVRELAAEAGVNPNTMQRALAQLESDGLVVTNRTVGRLVTDDARVVEETRRRLAAGRTDEYAEGMRVLGYDRVQAADFLMKGTKENGE